MRLLLLVLLALSFVLSGCTKKTPPSQEAPVVEKKRVTKPLPEDPVQKAFVGVVRVLMQADAIHREAWWVLSEQRPGQGRTIFGRLARAAATLTKEKIPSVSSSCEKFELTKNISGLSGYPHSIKVFEACTKQKSLIAEWSAASADKLTATFYGQHFEKELGLATIILNPRIQCEFTVKPSDFIIQTMDCRDFHQDLKDTEVAKLTTYRFSTASKNTLILKGSILVNLQPLRKIEVTVPVDGQILVEVTQVEEEIDFTETIAPAPPLAAPGTVPPPAETMAPDRMKLLKDRPPGPSLIERAAPNAGQTPPPVETEGQGEPEAAAESAPQAGSEPGTSEASPDDSAEEEQTQDTSEEQTQEGEESSEDPSAEDEENPAAPEEGEASNGQEEQPPKQAPRSR